MHRFNYFKVYNSVVSSISKKIMQSLPLSHSKAFPLLQKENLCPLSSYCPFLPKLQLLATTNLLCLHGFVFPGHFT